MSKQKNIEDAIHDLRGQLGIIVLYTEMLGSTTAAQNPEEQEAIKSIQDACDESVAILERLASIDDAEID